LGNSKWNRFGEVYLNRFGGVYLNLLGERPICAVTSCGHTLVQCIAIW
jgi:hypothetical protein